MKTPLRFALSLIASFLFVLGAQAQAQGQAIGVISAVSGQVQLLRGDVYLAGARGVDVHADDIVETGKGAAAQLDMEDGSVLKLGPQTRLALSDYRLDANKNVVSATLDVLSGWLRFAVAKLKPEGRYGFNTPLLTIGVRGTEGTIEAENEQGGLHLEEGAVDVSPFGQDILKLPPLRVVSGEFIQRARGQPLAKLSQPPEHFRNRLPPVVRDKLERRVQDLKERGVPPKVIREITRDDAKHLIERHPHMQDKLRERFKPQRKPPLAPGKDGDARSGKDADGKPAGFGGQILRERQLKTGAPTDPKEVSEAMRRRFQQQEQDKAAAPRVGDKPPSRPLGLPPKQEPAPLRQPSLGDKPLPRAPTATDKLEPPTADKPAIGDKPLLLKPPTDTKSDDSSAPAQPVTPATPLPLQTSPIQLQRTAPAPTK
jgi:hypothetical protein